MKNLRIALPMILAATAAFVASAGKYDASYKGWSFILSPDKQLTIKQKNQILLSGVRMTAQDSEEKTHESDKYASISKTEENVSDTFGKGRRFTWTYSEPGKPTLQQVFTVYPALSYATVEGAILSDDENFSSRKICPVVTDRTVALPLDAEGNRIYDMPFANDNWATYNSRPWTDAVTSCEGTALYSTGSRRAIVIGSVDHSVWKSAVSVAPAGGNKIKGLTVEAGYVSPRTWDNGNFGNHTPINRHGAVRGKRVVSPKFMIGLFDDWRTGLETFGEANTVLCPKLKMPTGDKAIFGWQSWGGQEAQLNYKSTSSVLDFFDKEIKPAGFAGEDGVCWMVLDSFWTNMSRDQLRAFARRCKELGYRPGIYTTPFSLWCGTDEEISDYPFETIDGHTYSRRDVVLRADGRPRKIVGYSLDPTHPAVREWNRKTFRQFKDDGFEFVKIDFMNNGSQEADSWYNPDITTGMMAYNYGLDYLVEMAGDMALDFSIAPVFPAKAHIRRIGCDAWGELNNSMYTLNCIQGSWWLDRIYSFNDPDHMCLSKVFTGKGSNDENEARIRYTTGLITGMTLFGGTYACEGDTMNYNNKRVHIIGTPEERDRAVKIAANKDLTEMGRIGRTFRPVEGIFAQKATLFSRDDISVDREFVYDTPDAFYYVVFNYDTETSFEAVPDFNRLGVRRSEFGNVKELWSGEVSAPDSFKVSVPAKDVRVYRFERKK